MIATGHQPRISSYTGALLRLALAKGEADTELDRTLEAEDVPLFSEWGECKCCGRSYADSARWDAGYLTDWQILNPYPRTLPEIKGGTKIEPADAGHAAEWKQPGNERHTYRCLGRCRQVFYANICEGHIKKCPDCGGGLLRDLQVPVDTKLIKRCPDVSCFAEYPIDFPEAQCKRCGAKLSTITVVNK